MNESKMDNKLIRIIINTALMGLLLLIAFFISEKPAFAWASGFAFGFAVLMFMMLPKGK